MGKTKCCKYNWWVEHIGRTVKVTRGAFKGKWGRLNAVGSKAGAVKMVLRGKVWIVFADLELWNDA